MGPYAQLGQHGMLSPRNNVMWVGEVVDNHGRFMTFYKSHDEVFENDHYSQTYRCPGLTVFVFLGARA